MRADSDIVLHPAGDYLLECGLQAPELGPDIAGNFATSFQVVAGFPPPPLNPPPAQMPPPPLPPLYGFIDIEIPPDPVRLRRYICDDPVMCTLNGCRRDGLSAAIRPTLAA
jgi:hypothetical protein